MTGKALGLVTAFNRWQVQLDETGITVKITPWHIYVHWCKINNKNDHETKLKCEPARCRQLNRLR